MQNKQNIYGLYLNTTNNFSKINIIRLLGSTSKLKYFYISYDNTKILNKNEFCDFLKKIYKTKCNTTIEILINQNTNFINLKNFLSKFKFDRIVIKVAKINNLKINKIVYFLNILKTIKYDNLVFDFYETDYKFGFISKILNQLKYDIVKQFNIYYKNEIKDFKNVITESKKWISKNFDWELNNDLSIRRKNYVSGYIKFLTSGKNYLGIGDNAISYINYVFYKTVFDYNQNCFFIKSLYKNNPNLYWEAIKNKIVLNLIENNKNYFIQANQLLKTLLNLNLEFNDNQNLKIINQKKFNQIQLITNKIDKKVKIDLNRFNFFHDKNKLKFVIKYLKKNYI